MSKRLDLESPPLTNALSDLNPGALRACEQVAKTPEAGRQAYLLWCIAQDIGWPAVRERTSRSGWFRYLAVLRKAGLPVPRGENPKPPAAHEVSWATRMRPQQAFELVGSRFRVVKPWDEAFYPAGSTGRVDALLLRNFKWLVGVDMEDIPREYVEISLATFLRSTIEVAQGGSDADG
ncbi:MAG: hypothetical protein Kow006_08360 [Gammaproteobacteria bacterium]